LPQQVIQDELGAPWYEIYAELTPEPIAAASLGQVYRGRLKSGEEVAVKVQRPAVLETVTIDLYIIRKLGMFLRRFPQVSTDVVALLDEWAARFFEVKWGWGGCCCQRVGTTPGQATVRMKCAACVTNQGGCRVHWLGHTSVVPFWWA
jgi:hypothetical protein